MKYRKLDSSGDYTFGKRDDMYSGTEAVAQAVKTRLLLLLGEWWENPKDGTPLFEKILGQRYRTDEPQTETDLILSERINGTQGVAEIINFDSGINPEKREYYAAITIKTIYGSEFQVQLSSGNTLLGIIIK